MSRHSTLSVVGKNEKEDVSIDRSLVEIRNEKNIEKYNFTIIEKISVISNSSNAVYFFNEHFTKLDKFSVSLTINNKTFKIYENFYYFKKIGIYSVVISFFKKLDTMQDMFNHCFNIIELDLSGIDTIVCRVKNRN